MVIIIGLGNPIPKYQGTRHNIGQIAISYFREVKKFPRFELKKKFESLISQGKINDKKIILVLPQTFMNEAGRAIKKIISNFEFRPANLWIIHDDIDLSLGKIRIRKTGSSAGHKGVLSIISALGEKNFIRIRLGIGRSEKKTVEKFVLEKFSPKEKVIVKKVIKKTGELLETSLKGELKEQTISLFSCLPEDFH